MAEHFMWGSNRFCTWTEFFDIHLTDFFITVNDTNIKNLVDTLYIPDEITESLDCILSF